MNKIRLWDGVLYDPWSPTGPVPAPATIAYGLAHLCRYGGHVSRMYSVCEHSIWVSLFLACGGPTKKFLAAATNLCDGRPYDVPNDRARFALLGLVHDVSEGCGLVDLPGPIGAHPEMDAYKAAHHRCTDWLLRGWGIMLPTESEYESVKAADIAVLGPELDVRPPGADGTGSGETLSRWPGFNLAERHNLQRLGTQYVRDTWVSMFGALSAIGGSK